MTYVNTTQTAGRSAGFFGTLFAAVMQRRIFARTVSELERLGDRELNDLGIARCDINRVAREATYGE